MSKLFSIALLLFSFLIFGQKSPLSHADYDAWKTISAKSISDSGIWVSWQSNPQKGDGTLHVVSKSVIRTYDRGVKQVFSPSERYVFFEEKPKEEERRQALFDKVSKKDMPSNKLIIARPIKNTVDTIHDIVDWKSSEIINDLLAWRAKEPKPDKPEEDESKEDKKKKDDKSAKKSKKLEDVHPLYVRTFFPSVVHELKDSKLYDVARQGGAVVYSAYVDSSKTFDIRLFDANTKSTFLIEEGLKDVASLTVSPKGLRVAFIATKDTVEAKDANYNLYYYEVNAAHKNPVKRRSTVSEVEDFSVHRKATLNFTHNAQFLFFGVHPDRYEVEVDTNLLDEDKAQVDVWTPFDKELQPRQLVRKKDWENHFQTVVLKTSNRKVFRLPGNEHSSYNYQLNQSHPLVVHSINLDYANGEIWTFGRYKRYSVINLNTEQETIVHDSSAHGITISPSGKWAYGFDEATLGWYSIDVENNRKYGLGADIAKPVHNFEVDIPNQYPPFGVAGLTKSENQLWIYDQHDIWSVDMKAAKASSRLTKGAEHNVRYRYLKAHKDDDYVDKRTFIQAVDRFHRDNALCRMQDGKLDTLRHFTDAAFTGFAAAKHRNRYVYQIGSFNEYPELYRLLLDKEDEKLSITNPQKERFYWGNVSYVDYVVNGDSLRGLLYKPEQSEDMASVPLIVYFYERYADQIHRHVIPTASRSIINFPYYVSNGYAIFIPDIAYETGKPGQSAYDCIMTGLDTVLNQNNWINRDAMALNGQSWGGYQTAWLVTQTNRFKAAFSGAPVSNMTSAYGGIRWKTGHSRIMQYEEGQSRLGVPMHENLAPYLENSPLFYTDKIETPLLIMHNDNDGAVPWYQGIELYMSMIRQQKDVWMLVYNNEEHNLTRWANRMDLSERVSAFYDHYLKGAPMPDWMKQGVPVWEKGKQRRR